jgi:hypothetical protein
VENGIVSKNCSHPDPQEGERRQPSLCQQDQQTGTVRKAALFRIPVLIFTGRTWNCKKGRWSLRSLGGEAKISQKTHHHFIISWFKIFIANIHYGQAYKQTHTHIHMNKTHTDTAEPLFNVLKFKIFPHLMSNFNEPSS